MSLLFSPLQVKTLAFPNRIAMPPMVRFHPPMSAEVTDTHGKVTPAVVDYYRRRAAAGVGLIIVEATAAVAGGRVWEQGLNAYADEHIPGLARLAEAIRAEGAVPGIQLVHGGPQADPALCGGEIVGPSAVPAEEGATLPKPLAAEEIAGIQESFARAAQRVVEAGFRVVELHGAHGYLLDSFLSVERNRRTDAYGGDLGGRMRFLVETCARVHRQLAGRALLDCRISPFGHLDAGFGPADLAQLLRGLEGAGVEIVHLSTEGALKGYWGAEKTVGQWAKGYTRLPIIVAGGLRRPESAERAIAEGHADLAAVGTAMIKHADWAQKAREALK